MASAVGHRLKLLDTIALTHGATKPASADDDAPLLRRNVQDQQAPPSHSLRRREGFNEAGSSQRAGRAERACTRAVEVTGAVPLLSHAMHRHALPRTLVAAGSAPAPNGRLPRNSLPARRCSGFHATFSHGCRTPSSRPRYGAQKCGVLIQQVENNSARAWLLATPK